MLRKKPNNQSGLGSIKLGMCYAAKDGISVTRFGDFFALWATIQSWWQQLVYPHC